MPYIFNLRTYPVAFGGKFLSLLEMFRSRAEGKPTLTPEVEASLDARYLFRDLPWGDMWEDAEIVELVVYLRGNKNLRIPEHWRDFLPTSVPCPEKTH